MEKIAAQEAYRRYRQKIAFYSPVIRPDELGRKMTRVETSSDDLSRLLASGIMGGLGGAGIGKLVKPGPWGPLIGAGIGAGAGTGLGLLGMAFKDPALTRIPKDEEAAAEQQRYLEHPIGSGVGLGLGSGLPMYFMPEMRSAIFRHVENPILASVAGFGVPYAASILGGIGGMAAGRSLSEALSD